MRLQKLIASAGIASRRKAEDLIIEGRVEVNDEIEMTLGRKIDPDKDVVRVDGERVNFKRESITVAVNKPRGVVSTMEDPQGRPTLADVVGNKYGRLFHIGRLDTDSEGLILMSNDGDFAHLVAHPTGEIPKTYVATLNKKIEAGDIRKLLKGLELKDGFAKFDKARILGSEPNRSIVECVLHSGKNRIVRRMFKDIGFTVTRLVRVQIGAVRLGELRPGGSRVLSEVEVAAIEAMSTKGKKISQFDISQKTKTVEKNKSRRQSSN